MNALPKISVIVPSYNQAVYLERTLLSILDQNYPNLELIVIDGGSTDASVDTIRKYESAITYWVSEPDGGQTRGLIKGFARATGDIECWLNSDDLFQPGALHECAEFMSKHPDVDAVFGDSMWIDPQDNPIRPQREIPFVRFLWMYTYNYIPGMSMFWRRSAYERVGGLDPKFDLAMDADLWIRIAAKGKIAHVKSIWSCMRFYPDQKNRRLRERSDQEDRMIRERYIGVQKPYALAAKRAMAMAIRIGWKFLSGCYGIGYKRYLQDKATTANA